MIFAKNINVVFHSNKSDTSVIVHKKIFEGLMPMLQVAPPRLLVPYNVTSSRLQLYTSTLGLRSVAISGFSGYWQQGSNHRIRVFYRNSSLS